MADSLSELLQDFGNQRLQLAKGEREEEEMGDYQHSKNNLDQ
jgi:hypothetical protein